MLSEVPCWCVARKTATTPREGGRTEEGGPKGRGDGKGETAEECGKDGEGGGSSEEMGRA